MKEKRGAAFRVPDRGISLCRFLGALRQNKEVENKPFDERIEIDDTGITEKLAEIFADVCNF